MLQNDSKNFILWGDPKTFRNTELKSFIDYSRDIVENKKIVPTNRENTKSLYLINEQTKL